MIAAPPQREHDASGFLRVAASARGGRTVIDTLRQEGLARCSRPLSEPSTPGAVRLVVSQLGPGFVRGDRFETHGTLGPGADLIVAAQSATRILGHGAVSTARTTWTLAENARLFIAGEPAIPHDGASHLAETRVDLARGASLTWLDALAPHGRFRSVTTALRVFAESRLAIHDRAAYGPAELRTAVATGFYLRAGMTAAETGRVIAIADASAAQAHRTVAIGAGSPACGGVLLRATGTSVRDALDAVAGILIAVRRTDAVECR